MKPKLFYLSFAVGAWLLASGMLFLAGCSPTAHVTEPQKSKTATMSVQDVPHAMPTADTPVDSCAIANIYVGRTVSGRRQLKPIICGLPPMPGMETEDAIMKSLRWLKAKQNTDGTWSKDAPESVTALALLCFLAHGELTDSKEFGATVEKAANYLATRMKMLPDGGVLTPQTPEAHALVTLALAEMYGMTQNPILMEPVKKGLAVILAGQQSAGGWAVGYQKDGDWNLAFSTRQIQALTAGIEAVSDHSPYAQSRNKAAEFILKTASKDGVFFNTPVDKATSAHAQAAGAFCLYMTEQTDSPEFKAISQWLRDHAKPAWKDDTRITQEGGMDAGLVDWYFQSAAKLGEKKADQDWKIWNAQLSKELLPNQEKDGYWNSPPATTGSTVTSVTASDADLYYVTAYCCLTLEVKYRFLPSLHLPKEEPVPLQNEPIPPE